MSQFFQIHPTAPQGHLIRQAVEIIRGGGLVALPTGSCYTLACYLDNKSAVKRLRHVRGIDEKHHLTLIYRDLSELATFARVDNKQYRVLKAATPGPFVFLLETTKEVPRQLSHLSRKTADLRIPEHTIPLALIAELGKPLLSTTLQLPGDDELLNETKTIRDRLEKRLGLVIDGGPVPAEPTTIVDSTGGGPELVRQDRGDPTRVGLQANPWRLFRWRRAATRACYNSTSMDPTLIQGITVYAILVPFTITLRGAVHGYVAKHFGDDTAYVMGRTSINPLRRVDPIGTIAMPLLLYSATHGAFMFSYVRPMPVCFDRLRDPRWHGVWVALAGLVTNLGQAIFWGVLAVVFAADDVGEPFLVGMTRTGILVSMVVAAFSMFPLPPLDDERMLVALLPPRVAPGLSHTEPFGFSIMMALIISNVIISVWVRPIMAPLFQLLQWILSPLQILLS